MFELAKAYEIARTEKNKFLRFFYLIYTKRKLKSSFFDKFDIEKMVINKDFLMEFLYIYKSIGFTDQDKIYLKINKKYPHVILVDPQLQWIELEYYGFGIDIKIVSDDNFNISILRTPKTTDSITHHIDTAVLNMSMFKPIILMTIYNYCVSYIYGYNSSLYIDDKQYIDRLYDLYN